MHSSTYISYELSNAAESELEPGESIEWMGQPIPSFFTPSTTILFLFAIPWTLFALFWMIGVSAATHGKLSFIPLFGLPFVFVGIFLLLSPYFHYRKALRTLYVITDRRAVILICGRHKEVRSYQPRELTKGYRREKRNGSGDLIFETILKQGGKRTYTEDVGFVRISEVREVEGRIKKLASKAGGTQDSWG